MKTRQARYLALKAVEGLIYKELNSPSGLTTPMDGSELDYFNVQDSDVPAIQRELRHIGDEIARKIERMSPVEFEG